MGQGGFLKPALFDEEQREGSERSPTSNPSLADTYLTFEEGEGIREGKVYLVQNDFYFLKMKKKS